MKRVALFGAVAILTVGPAVAHDFWLQPRTFRLATGGQTEFSIQVGHGSLRQPAGIAPERVETLKTIGPNGSVDQRTSLQGGFGKAQGKILDFPL